MRFNGRKETLHSLWDTALVELEEGTPAELAAQIQAAMTSDDRQHWQQGTPADWALESLAIVRAQVYRLPDSGEMSCYRVLKREGLIQPKRIGHDLREAAERRRQMLKAPENLNEVLQGDFTDYVTEDGEKYRIGCITEYLSRFNLVSEVLDTETALDLIAVTEAALKEITELGHELVNQIILVTDNGPAMKARRFRNFVKKSEMLIHVRSRKYHPQTIGREERYHGSLKLEHLYRVLPNNRTELIEAVKNYREFYNYQRLHMSLGYRTPVAVYLTKDGHKL